MAGLAGRSAIDKVLALRGGADLVARWAQLHSVIELVSGVAVAGVGTGISVLVAQAARVELQRALLSGSFRPGIACALPVMLAMVLLAWLFPRHATSWGVSPALVTLGALVGTLAVFPGMVNGYWLGQQRRGRMLALAVATAVLPVAAALWGPPTRRSPRWRSRMRCRRPSPRGSPAVTRRPPHTTSCCSALHRCGSLGGHPQPGIDAGRPRHRIRRAVVGGRRAAAGAVARSRVGRRHRGGRHVGALPAAHERRVRYPTFRRRDPALLFPHDGRPSAVALGLLLAFHRPVFTLLYDDSVVPTFGAALWFLAGSLVRIAAWVPLFALYAMRRTGAIAVGELISLPLFAALLAACSDFLTLELAAALWLASYLAYGAFNVWTVRSGGPPPRVPCNRTE